MESRRLFIGYDGYSQNTECDIYTNSVLYLIGGAICMEIQVIWFMSTLSD